MIKVFRYPILFQYIYFHLKSFFIDNDLKRNRVQNIREVTSVANKFMVAVAQF